MYLCPEGVNEHGLFHAAKQLLLEVGSKRFFVAVLVALEWHRIAEVGRRRNITKFSDTTIMHFGAEIQSERQECALQTSSHNYKSYQREDLITSRRKNTNKHKFSHLKSHCHCHSMPTPTSSPSPAAALALLRFACSASSCASMIRASSACFSWNAATIYVKHRNTENKQIEIH